MRLTTQTLTATLAFTLIASAPALAVGNDAVSEPALSISETVDGTTVADEVAVLQNTTEATVEELLADDAAAADVVIVKTVDGEIFTGEVTPQERAELNASEEVLIVEEDSLVTIADYNCNTESVWATNCQYWGLDRINQNALPLDGYYPRDGNGSGVVVYVIDTGIDYTHSELTNARSTGFDAVDNDTDPMDCNAHGTHVAGIIGSDRWGVAPEVTLVGVRVLNCGGTGTVSGLIEGLQWVTDNHAGSFPGQKAVVNMSVSANLSVSLNTTVDLAVAAGITVVAAAGNNGTNASAYSPASAASAITVGASDWNDAAASFSNFGAGVDVYAPGVQITSALLGDGQGALNGTSMASPHVAGAIATYLSDNPASTPTDVDTWIKANAVETITGSAYTTKLLQSNVASRPATVADAPSGVSAVAADSEVTVTWTAPVSDGGSPITSYTVTAVSAGQTLTTSDGSTLTGTLTGLTNGTDYTFTVVANNAVGISVASNPSNVVTPTVLAPAPAPAAPAPSAPAPAAPAPSAPAPAAPAPAAPSGGGGGGGGSDNSISQLSSNSGSVVGGETIAISGGDFTTARAVMFGDTPSPSFIVIAGHHIDAVVPPSAGAGIVDVHVVLGPTVGRASLWGGYTYLPVAAPAPNQVLPAQDADADTTSGQNSDVKVKRSGKSVKVITTLDAGTYSSVVLAKWNTKAKKWKKVSYKVNNDGTLTFKIPSKKLGLYRVVAKRADTGTKEVVTKFKVRKKTVKTL